MQNNEKLMQFNQALQSAYCNDSNLEITDDFQPQETNHSLQRPPKNRSGVESFLESIDSMTFNLMREYLIENKSFLDKPLPPKISLYEDVKIIYEFKKGEAEIILNKGKGRQAISEKLSLNLRRSKATILDRMKKKLYKLTPQDIEYAIKTKTNFNFEKKEEKSKSTIPQTTHKNSNKETREIKKEQLSFQRPKQRKEMYGLSNLIDDWDKSIASKYKKRIYKYGKKEEKGRIYIYADMNQKQIAVLNEVEAHKLREDLMEQEKKAKERLNQIKNAEKKTSEEEILSSNKNEENQQNNTDAAQNQAEIEPKETKGKPQEVNPTTEENKEDSQSFSFMHKRINSANHQPLSKEQQLNCQQSIRKMLFRLNNNEKNLQLLFKDAQLKNELVWSDEQDELLYQFSFNPETSRLGMICLLRYKPFEYIMERINFLNLELQASTLAYLKDLAGKEDEPMDIVNDQ